MADGLCHRAQLVVTIPDKQGYSLSGTLKARTTHGVLIELAAMSEKSLIIPSPYIYLSEEIIRGSLIGSIGSAVQRGVKLYVVSTSESLMKFKKYLPWLIENPNVQLTLVQNKVSGTALLSGYFVGVRSLQNSAKRRPFRHESTACQSVCPDG